MQWKWILVCKWAKHLKSDWKYNWVRGRSQFALSISSKRFKSELCLLHFISQLHLHLHMHKHIIFQVQLFSMNLRGEPNSYGWLVACCGHAKTKGKIEKNHFLCIIVSVCVCVLEVCLCTWIYEWKWEREWKCADCESSSLLTELNYFATRARDVVN